MLEGRSVSELAAAHGVHRSWIYKLLGRYRAGGYEALEARSRRPRSCRHETPPATVKAIVGLREELDAQGYDSRLFLGSDAYLRVKAPESRCLRPLLQPHPPAQSPPPPHSSSGSGARWHRI